MTEYDKDVDTPVPHPDDTTPIPHRFAEWRHLPRRALRRNTLQPSRGLAWVFVAGAIAGFWIQFANDFGGLATTLVTLLLLVAWLLFDRGDVSRVQKELRRDLASELSGTVEPLSATLFAEIQFKLDGITYAIDHGLIVLTSSAVVFDGEQTTFSVPARENRIRFGPNKDIDILFPFTGFSIHVSGSQVRLNEAESSLRQVLAIVPFGTVPPETDFGPPLAHCPGQLRRRAWLNAALPTLGVTLAFALYSQLATFLLSDPYGPPSHQLAVTIGGWVAVLVELLVTVPPLFRLERMLRKLKFGGANPANFLNDEWKDEERRAKWRAEIEKERQLPPLVARTDLCALDVWMRWR